MKIQKRYIVLMIIVVLSGILIWRVSTSYASMDIGYVGNNIVSGDKWGINITEIGDVVSTNDALVVGDISSIATTLDFNVLLLKPGDKISFDVTVENTSTLKGELYAIALSGLSNEDGENITYTVTPVDSSILHTDKVEGSILNIKDKQIFNVTVSYDDNVSIQNNKEYQLNLGATIIYKQK